VLVVFTAADDSRSTSTSVAGERRPEAERCHVTYGDVIDKAARKNVSICRGRAGQNGGLSRVYVSQSNLLHILFTQPAASAHQQQQQRHNFVIHVEGIGTSFSLRLVSIISDHFSGRIELSELFVSGRFMCPTIKCEPCGIDLT